MASDAVVGFKVWMEVIALDVESDGLRMLLAVTGSYCWQLYSYLQLYSYWQLFTVF